MEKIIEKIMNDIREESAYSGGACCTHSDSSCEVAHSCVESNVSEGESKSSCYGSNHSHKKSNI